MTSKVLSAAVLAAVCGALVACNETPVQPVAVAPVSEAGSYRPIPQPKPLPTFEGYAPGGASTGAAGAPGAAAPGGGLTISPNPSIQNEDAFVAIYAKHNARMMIFVNRTLKGDPIPTAQLQEISRVERTQSATGAVAVTNTNTVTGSGQSASSGFGGSSASTNNINRNTSSSFTSGGPAQYSASTSVMTAPDTFGLTGADYQAVEMSITQYFNNSGKVDVRDSEAARAKLDREQVLRIENGDSAANRLLATEHLADVIVHITASPTTQSAYGRAVRLNAKAVGTTDGRLLGVCSLDLPLPLTRPIINDFTRHMTEELMKQMAIKWAVGPEYDPIEVRIYKAASIDDSSKIATWIKKAPGVSKVDLAQATGGSSTSYAVVKVAFNGSPWALYEEIKDSVGQSQGLKAVDLQNNTINLEISGPMNLVTTTRAVETTTTTETHVTEQQKVEPISPAPAQPR